MRTKGQIGQVTDTVQTLSDHSKAGHGPCRQWRLCGRRAAQPRPAPGPDRQSRTPLLPLPQHLLPHLLQTGPGHAGPLGCLGRGRPGLPRTRTRTGQLACAAAPQPESRPCGSTSNSNRKSLISDITSNSTATAASATAAPAPAAGTAPAR